MDVTSAKIDNICIAVCFAFVSALWFPNVTGSVPFVCAVHLEMAAFAGSCTAASRLSMRFLLFMGFPADITASILPLLCTHGP